MAKSQGTPSTAGSHRSWEREHGTDCPLESLEGALPCQHLDFRFPASGTENFHCFKLFTVNCVSPRTRMETL